jgi:hypothetical protein
VSIEAKTAVMWAMMGTVDLSQSISGRIVYDSRCCCGEGSASWHALEVLGMFLANGSPRKSAEFQFKVIRAKSGRRRHWLNSLTVPPTLPPTEKGRWIIEHLPSLQWDRSEEALCQRAIEA